MDDPIITDQKKLAAAQPAPGAGGILLTIFLCVLIPVLSFYAPDGYQELGNRKFEAWRLIAAIFALPLLVITAVWRIRSHRSEGTASHAGLKQKERGHIRAVDFFVILYGVFLTVSFLLSYDRAESLWGTTGWRMGYLTEILFLLYYMFARIYPIRFRIVVPVALLSGGGVILTAILERVGIYPLSWQMPEATFVSTIGNVDWYCGYLAMIMSLAAALCLGGRMRERICGAVLFAACVCSAVILGANTGILLLISFLPAFLLVIGDRDRTGRLFRALAILLFLGLIGAYFGMLLAFHPAVWLPDRWYRLFTAGFGNGRGAIWRYAYALFDRLPLWRRFVGVGPDAFARYSYDDPQLVAVLTENFGMARLTNAHSELITMLLDEGILTVISYLLLLISALIRIVRYHSGSADMGGSQAAVDAEGADREAGSALTSAAIFAMVSLSVVQAVNFRTISATPFLFLLIGAAIRETETGHVREITPSGQDDHEEEE
ncbi:MAG: O-antigen ligase family protein [Lachnospiraceae bacterium]|nr:O-antigen ligase family protein [Lachnospiraceae bacterium]